MKKRIAVFGIAVLVVFGVLACKPTTTEPTTTPTTTTEHVCFEPFYDEEGRLNVDVCEPDVFE